MGVIAIHVSGYGIFDLNIYYKLFYVLMNNLTRFAVPFFIIISGMVLSYKYANNGINYISFIKKRISFIFIPYLFFVLIYYYFFHIARGESFSVINFLKYIISGYVAPHLYFIPLIFQFYILFPIFISIAKYLNSKKLLTNLVVFIIFGIISIYSVCYLHILSWGFPLMITQAYFFLFGCILGLNIRKFKDEFLNDKENLIRILILWSILAVYIILDGLYLKTFKFYNDFHFYFYYFGITGYSILLFILLFKLSNYIHNKKIFNIILKIGQYSFGIYLIHYLFVRYDLFIRGIYQLLKGVINNNFLKFLNNSIINLNIQYYNSVSYFILYFILVLILSYITTYLFTELKIKIKKHRRTLL
ncbi:acyltransferase [Methanocaldococcus lauensis]|uniref:acyltransferase n=1 Tax=Methanocaldococcus lauensis TaxID=2546128 RepID=UPI003742D632